MGKLFAIGDIHGCYDMLVELIAKLPIEPQNDTVVFLGDYIDRGPDSYAVIEFLLNFQRRHPKAVFLKGNHEQLLELFLNKRDPMTFLANGGKQTLASYQKRDKNPDAPVIPPEHLRFFEELRLYHETRDFVFVHAGLRENIALENQKVDDMLWIRERFIKSSYDFGKRIVFGHTPFVEPYEKPNKIGIDTGAVYGNHLTCVQLPEVVYFKV